MDKNYSTPILYSTNTFLKFIIDENWGPDKYFAWCSEFFDQPVLGMYSLSSIVPLSSPAEIYRHLMSAVNKNDYHDHKIMQQKATLQSLAEKWKRDGKITEHEKKDIFSIIKLAKIEEMRPLIYIIPRALVEQKMQFVPASKRAGLGREYILEGLNRSEFDIIEPSGTKFSTLPLQQTSHQASTQSEFDIIEPSHTNFGTLLPQQTSHQASTQFYSCFLSYSSEDNKFAKILYDTLLDNGVRCYFAPEDLRIGEKIRNAIHNKIRSHDKVLLILSKNSVKSDWVEDEVERAFERERRENKIILFPIMIDNYIMEIEQGWPLTIRNTRNIGDFSNWKERNKYNEATERLLRDLKSDMSSD